MSTVSCAASSISTAESATAFEVDALMLSGETAAGRYPVLAVEHMRRIGERTEAHLAAQPQAPAPPERLRRSRYRTAALAHGVWTVARDLDARVIVVWSQRGGGARYLSQNRFAIPIVALTSDEHSAREMLFMRGVIPLVSDVPAGLVAPARGSELARDVAARASC